MNTLIRSREFWLALIVAAMILATNFRAPGFASPSNLANIFNDTAILMILALGQMTVILTRSKILVMLLKTNPSQNPNLPSTFYKDVPATYGQRIRV